MTTPDGGAGALVLPPRSPGVAVKALVRPAKDLRLGDYLAFERDDDQPFRITSVRDDERGRGHHGVDLVWGQVTQLGRLGSVGCWWRPPSCSFASDSFLTTTLFNRSPVLLQPSRNGVVTP